MRDWQRVLSHVQTRTPWAREAALEAAAHYRDIPIQFVEVELDEAIRLSKQQDIYAYDAYMLSVAKRHRAPLLTLDGGLKEAARQNNVKLLEIDS